jgi:hypothetical protein
MSAVIVASVNYCCSKHPVLWSRFFTCRFLGLVLGRPASLPTVVTGSGPLEAEWLFTESNYLFAPTFRS